MVKIKIKQQCIGTNSGIFNNLWFPLKTFVYNHYIE